MKKPSYPKICPSCNRKTLMLNYWNHKEVCKSCGFTHVTLKDFMEHNDVQEN